MGVIVMIIKIVVIYFVITFFIPLLVLPNYLIYKPKHKITSKKLKEVVKKLDKIKDDERFAKGALNFLKSKYQVSGPITFFAHLHKLFWHNPNKIIERSGFSYCHVQNMMLKTILLESGRFKEEDIKMKLTFTGVIHQYLVVKVNGGWIEFDPWGYEKGVPYGKHLNLIEFFKAFVKHPRL